MSRRFLTAALFLLTAALLTPISDADAAELLMFETKSCPWCAAWRREVGQVYPRTEEGKRAALRRVDLDAPRPADLEHIKGVVYTPTFVLIDEGREIGRIMGYPGEDHFWGLLGELVKKLPPPAG